MKGAGGSKGKPPSTPQRRESSQGSSATLCALTHEDEPGAGQLGPLKEGVEHVLAFALQLVQLIQHQEAVGEPRSTPALSPHSTPSRESRAAARVPLLASRGDPTPPTTDRELTPWAPGLSDASPGSGYAPGQWPRAAPGAVPGQGRRSEGCPVPCSSAPQSCSRPARPAGMGMLHPTRCPPSPNSSPTAVAMAHTLQSSRTRLRQAVFPVPGAPDT